MDTPALKAQIEAAASEVYAALGCGRGERVYEEALSFEFRQRGIRYERQRKAEILYKGQTVGMGALDFIVDGHVVLELKAFSSITPAHRSQCAAYMRTTALPDGMIVNFPYPRADSAQVQIVKQEQGLDGHPRHQRESRGSVLNGREGSRDTGRRIRMDTPALRAEIEAAADEVYAALGCGREEGVYEEALSFEFRERGIRYERQRKIEILYKSQTVGMGALDFVVDGHVALSLKAVTTISQAHRSQCAAYMRTTALPDGMIVNFPYPQADSVQVQIVEQEQGPLPPAQPPPSAASILSKLGSASTAEPAPPQASTAPTAREPFARQRPSAADALPRPDARPASAGGSSPQREAQSRVHRPGAGKGTDVQPRQPIALLRRLWRRTASRHQAPRRAKIEPVTRRARAPHSRRKDQAESG